MSVQQNIRKVRRMRGVSARSVARHIGISDMSYSRLERVAKTVDPNLLNKIADYLNVDVQVFFDDKLTDSDSYNKELTKSS
ncbi:helix-turn-helix domain-containing protein [Convivina praedatoris]|uniref:HTH cro/C1-type domain-containing protein n=1 Tax=Convivina praedatoris TaxID=2880963 RepID=A0ABN8HB16_9LACO|nr:helix-turn-helix transcriptional regulator [Convivina sp. LMG 32447]CAH1856219.1 hypothetical protein R077815_01353 [Convivina sp. LMG 32447]CAH1857139.1 hypothetical protein LMG032447_01456 [Convivina sp. LMG 32447]